jgi:hypothetical protein
MGRIPGVLNAKITKLLRISGVNITAVRPGNGRSAPISISRTEAWQAAFLPEESSTMFVFMGLFLASTPEA